MLKKSLLKISFVGFGNVFNAALGLLFITALAKILPVEDFGRYALISSLLVSTSKLMDFGTNSLFVAKSIRSDHKILDTYITLRIVLFFIMLPISLIVIHLLRVTGPAVIPLFIFGFFGYGINHTLFAFFQKIEKFQFAVLINTLPAIIKGIVSVLIFTKLFQPSFTQAFGIFSTSIILSSLLIPKLPKDLKTFKLDLRGTFNFYKEAFPAGVSIMIHQSWAAVSNTIAKLTRTFTEVGIFSLANKFADAFSLVSLSVFTVLLPKNAARKKAELKYDLKETMVIALGILFLAFIATFVARFAITTLFQEKFVGSIEVLNILIYAASLTAIHGFMSNYFYIEDKAYILMLITTSKLAIFLIGTAFLVQIYSIKGIAIADFISAVFAFAATTIVIQRNLALPQS